MIAVDKALEIVLAHARALPAEDVVLPEALGRVLREDVRADLDQPPFDRAAMDGYSLRAEDAASPGAVLHVVGQVRAGRPSDRGVGPGEAIQIMTGAPVPAGATAVFFAHFIFWNFRFSCHD